jgi:hypothetical protein
LAGKWLVEKLVAAVLMAKIETEVRLGPRARNLERNLGPGPVFMK